MKIYIASYFDTRSRIRPFKDRLWQMGYEVISTWLDEVQKPSYLTRDEFWYKLASKDLAEVKACDIITVDTIDETPRGGREVELGFALGQHQSKLVLLVGPIRNVFHTLVDTRFETWEECLKYLQSLVNK